MTRFTDDQLDAIQEKPRPRGTLASLSDDDRPADLRSWLTRATRPGAGELQSFERFGRDPRDPCRLVYADGRDARTFRVKTQRDLMRNPRTTLVSVSDGWLKVPHLTAGEVEDVWAALCRLGSVLTDLKTGCSSSVALSTSAKKLPWVSTQPLGRPVVPEV